MEFNNHPRGCTSDAISKLQFLSNHSNFFITLDQWKLTQHSHFFKSRMATCYILEGLQQHVQWQNNGELTPWKEITYIINPHRPLFPLPFVVAKILLFNMCVSLFYFRATAGAIEDSKKKQSLETA